MTHIKTEDAPAYAVQPVMPIWSDDEIILRAKQILLGRLREPGIALTSPETVKDFLALELAELEHEEFLVLFLDNAHRFIAWESMFRGTVNAASIYPREVVKRCLFHNAAAVMFAHNHPSGELTPSQADKSITEKLKNALDLIDVRVVDHFIVGGGTAAYAFAEHGLI